jgi:hypothetical protein
MHPYFQTKVNTGNVLHQYTEYKPILIQPTHMQAKRPMANLQVQLSNGHGGVAEVSRSHGQSSWVIPTEKNQIKISI